jgi:methionine--tRNA ligase beta chain
VAVDDFKSKFAFEKSPTLIPANLRTMSSSSPPPAPQLKAGAPDAKVVSQEPTSSTSQAEASKVEKTQQKEKAQGKPKESSKKAPKQSEVPADSAEIDSSGDSLDPSKLDIRVGLVVRCWDHPDSDKLLCEEIDLGEGSCRSIASGLRAHYKNTELEGRKVIVLANLKERPMAGFKSQVSSRPVVSNSFTSRRRQL